MFVASNWDWHKGKVVDNGHCVRFIQVLHPAIKHTSHWRRGEKVRGSGAPPGTIIATFHPTTHRYENDTTGRSHVAVLLEEVPTGLRVVDQWVGRAVGERTILFRGGVGQWVNDGDRYYTVRHV